MNENDHDARQRMHVTILADLVRELAWDSGRNDVADRALKLMELVNEEAR